MTQTGDQLPHWTLEDAYGSVTDERYTKELAHVQDLMKTLSEHLDHDLSFDEVVQWMPVYEDAFVGISSLISFAYCASAIDVTDTNASSAFGQTQMIAAQLDAIGQPLFKMLGTLAEDDPRWENEAVVHWRFNTLEKKNSWKSGLTSEQSRLINEFAGSSFYPLDAVYKRLNKRLAVKAKNSAGEEVTLTYSQCVGVLKGATDPVLRETAQEAVNAWYKQHADDYVDVLNLLHGFRKVQFHEAGLTDWMKPSLEQNRMSREALDAAIECIHNRIDEIREAIRVRAPFFGRDVMKACDFFAPIPVKSADKAAYIPYDEAIKTVKAALVEVNPDIPAFIDMMLQNHWLDARVDANKGGGAFYSRFNRFKQTRVFTTYQGSFASVIQQSHELGHAFHYWVMRDMPTNLTEFPMTLTEVASTFNEANLRRYCAAHSQSDEERLAILWQELVSCANFCLQLPVRMDFEKRFIARRQEGLVKTAEAEQMMQDVWHEYMGDAIEDCDPYLWCYKLHFYMTDQYIYNYAYMVGYLMSQGLCREQQKRGADFPRFYREFLRDTGRMTVDGLIQKHMGMDATTPEFWNQCIDQACSYIKEFKELTAKMKVKA